MKHSHNDMRIKVNATFLNPMTNRMCSVGDVLNVEKNSFWLRRLKSKDVEQVKAKTKSAQKLQDQDQDQPTKAYNKKK